MASITQYTILGTTDSVTTCELCGRSDLKKTVAVADADAGAGPSFLGTTCAARVVRRPSSFVSTRAARADGHTLRGRWVGWRWTAQGANVVATRIVDGVDHKLSELRPKVAAAITEQLAKARASAARRL